MKIGQFTLVLLLIANLMSCSDDSRNKTNDSGDDLMNRAIVPDSTVPKIPDSLIQFDEDISAEKRKEIMDKI